MYDGRSNPASEASETRAAGRFRLSRRAGMRLAGLGALVSIFGNGKMSAAQDASPVASPDADCISDPEANVGTATRWFTEVLNDKRFDILEEILHPEIQLKPAAFSGMSGLDQVGQMVEGLLGAFPDASYTIDDVLAEGDKVVVRWTGTGTHEGEYAGVPATGEQKTWTGLNLFHFACGSISGIWAEADLLVQLGLTEAHEPAVIAASGTPAAECPTSTREEMERYAQIWHEVWVSHDVSTLEGLFSPNAIHHNGVGADAVGLAAIQQGLETFFAAFPDVVDTLEDVVVDGDRVASRYTATGTNTGSWYGAEPSGRTATVTGMSILRVECGQVVEIWSEVSGLPLWQQMGMLEGAATPEA